ncbi:MAG: NUDIX hydrolase [Clostridia bacterium]|nr:NUDIX hydrolase [Clostridia bacterium]
MAKEVVNKKMLIRGREVTFTFLSTKDAVVIVPRTKAGKIVLVRQIRPAVDEELLELPAGGIEKGEDPLQAAHRELAEETGYAAREIKLISSFYPSPGITTERMYMYLAEVGEQSGQQLDDGEDIAVEEYSPEEAWDLVKRGEIRDGKTIVGLSLLRSSRD